LLIAIKLRCVCLAAGRVVRARVCSQTTRRGTDTVSTRRFSSCRSASVSRCEPSFATAMHGAAMYRAQAPTSSCAASTSRPTEETHAWDRSTLLRTAPPVVAARLLSIKSTLDTQILSGCCALDRSVWSYVWLHV
jgi:hypothetical protein